MASSPIIIRTLQTDAEVDSFFRMCVRAFWPDADQESRFAWWHNFVVSTPGFEPRHVWGAFSGQAIVGGCVVHERTLLMPPAELETSCIALVATHAGYRRKGISRAIIEEVIRSARKRGHDLLLLGGIPNFYDQFGFVDIFDSVQHTVDCAYILSQPPSPCRVRPATLDDAPALLQLYKAHFQRYSGSFTRTLDEQVYRMRFRAPDNPPLLVMTPEGVPRGYLLCSSATAQERAEEVVADSWPAALALLQYQAHLLDKLPEPPAEVIWTLPPDSATLYHLFDAIKFPNTSPLPPYPNWYVMRSQMLHLPVAGWMARPADLDDLVRHLLPRWSLRIRNYVARWPERVALIIGDQRFLLQARDGAVTLAEGVAACAPEIRLSQAVFTQLLFGFRPVSWAAGQPGQEIAAEMIPALEGLFPTGHTWIAASDGF